MTGTNATRGGRTRHDQSSASIWQLYGYTILDGRGRHVGPVARVWTDGASQTLAFVGLNTGRLWRRTHVIPAQDARIDDTARSIQVAHRAEAMRAAPLHNTDVPLSSTQQRKVSTYYDHC